MTLYWKLRTIAKPLHRAHVAERLRALRAQLREEVTAKTSEFDLRLATWNIMHFGDGGGYQRQTDAMLYIAEIIDHFDLVAVQEVNTSLDQLEDLMKNYLGPDWDYIVTDATGGDLGNDERMAYLFRRGKVRFGKLAGEIVLPDGQTIVGDSGVANPGVFEKHYQFARTPFITGFECGWFSFNICTVHIYFGNPPKRPVGMSDADYAQLKADYMTIRKTEIKSLARYLAERQQAERKRELAWLKERGWDTEQSKANYVLLGDFNIVSPEHETMQALKGEGFDIPEGMENLPTTLGKEKRFYDQIAHRLGDRRVRHRVSGAFDFRKSVFRDEDADHYIDVAADPLVTHDRQGNPRPRDKAQDYFTSYRRIHQMSDHMLLWSAFQVDLAEPYLTRLEADARAEAN